MDGWTYGNAASEPTAKATFGTPEFTYSDSADGVYTSVKPTNAGTYYVKAAVADSSNYPSAELVNTFTIAQAQPAVEPPSASDIRSGNELSKSVLSGGKATGVDGAMLVTVLWRAEGKPVVDYIMPFADVYADGYYAEAVRWAASEGIVTGTSDTEFSPNVSITREQIAAIMFRYAKYKGRDVSAGENTNILSYAEYGSISEYALSAIQYMVGAGLMKGKTDTTINPSDNATRAEIAAIFQRFFETK